MTTETEIPALSSLNYFPFLNEDGNLSKDWQGKIGVYAIFNQEKILQFVGYSRDVYLGLKQHLVRQPQNCYWVKVQTITSPNRTLLENMRQVWIQENETIPLGNSTDEAKWTQPIDAKLAMTEAEKTEYQQSEELAKIKLLKTIARRVEAEVLSQLEARGVQTEIRFNPKLKEQGLLDLK